MQYESGAVVVEFTNNLQEMERIIASARRRCFQLISMNVEELSADKLRATLVLVNLPGGSDSFVALKKQIEKHIDVHNVKVAPNSMPSWAEAVTEESENPQMV